LSESTVRPLSGKDGLCEFAKIGNRRTRRCDTGETHYEVFCGYRSGTEQPLFAALDALLHFGRASRRSVSFQRANSHRRARKIVVLKRGSRIAGQMPPAVATLICGQIRSEDVRFTIGGVSTADERFGQVQIVICASKRSGAFKLAGVQSCGGLCPSFGRGFLVDRDPFGARGADGKRSGRRAFDGRPLG